MKSVCDQGIKHFMLHNLRMKCHHSAKQCDCCLASSLKTIRNSLLQAPMKALQISNISKIIRWHWIRGLYRHISISGHKKRSTQNDNWRLLLQIRIKYCHWDDKLLLLFIVQTTCHSKYMRKWERSQCRLQPCPMSQMKANEFLIRWQFLCLAFGLFY